ncbi:chorismate-binding protein [Candidatus Carsonella ruddii]|uniref:chorismate-binding protein n=1 Tax=Carsonella ruddii TaxID=114186 RepID=UPI003D81BB38
MISHNKVLFFKKFKLNTFIKKFLNKNFFCLEKNNIVFVFDFFDILNKNNIINKFLKKKYNIITKNINFYFLKKNYKNFKKYRFLFSFFGFTNFNFLQKNVKNNLKNNYWNFFPRFFFLYKKKNKNAIFFYILKRNFLLFTKKIKFFVIKIKNIVFKKIKIKKFFFFNYYTKKRLFFKNYCKIKKNINCGNITQCVISNIFILKNFLNYNYKKISSYNFYFSYNCLRITINSPEFLLRKEKLKNFTKPIAGTVDKKIKIKKILKNKKEISEHIMLLDLSLSDIFRNNVDKLLLKRLFYCEHYRNLIHIVSEIFFNSFNKDSLNIINSLFPAGTLSGSPKINSIKLINFLEKNNRIFYGGIFCISSKLQIETCLMIRFMLFTNNILIIESGAGVIDKSINILEWNETVFKKQHLIK